MPIILMKYFILFIALQLFLGFELKAQDEGKEEPEEKEVITNPKVNAARNLIKLKEGTLAIRLFTKQPLIDVYLKSGATTSANIIINQQLKTITYLLWMCINAFLHPLQEWKGVLVGITRVMSPTVPWSEASWKSEKEGVM